MFKFIFLSEMHVNEVGMKKRLNLWHILLTFLNIYYLNKMKLSDSEAYRMLLLKSGVYVELNFDYLIVYYSISSLPSSPSLTLNLNYISIIIQRTCHNPNHTTSGLAEEVEAFHKVREEEMAGAVVRYALVQANNCRKVGWIVWLWVVWCMGWVEWRRRVNGWVKWWLGCEWVDVVEGLGDEWVLGRWFR